MKGVMADKVTVVVTAVGLDVLTTSPEEDRQETFPPPNTLLATRTSQRISYSTTRAITTLPISNVRSRD
jgi:hypothetical protein